MKLLHVIGIHGRTVFYTKSEKQLQKEKNGIQMKFLLQKEGIDSC